MKRELSTMRDPSGFEFAKTIKEQELAAKIPNKLILSLKYKEYKEEVSLNNGWVWLQFLYGLHS